MKRPATVTRLFSVFSMELSAMEVSNIQKVGYCKSIEVDVYMVT